MDATDMTKAYIIGGGIASLSTAVLLIRDGKFRGSNIRVLEELEVAGGALDGSGDPLKGYVTRGVRRSTTVIPVMMPYITSEFSRRDVADRPPVIPDGAKNYALLGQYVEIPEDVVFTVEYSVRAAMHGVYGLLGLKRDLPPIFHGIADPKVALDALKTLMG